MPFSGDAASTVYQGQNMIVKGSREAGVYLENWQGITPFTETDPPDPVLLTGDGVWNDLNSTTLNGINTKFTEELVPSQWIIVSNDIWNVQYINSDTELIVSSPFTTAVPVGTPTPCYKTQIVTEVDNVRANLVRGSIIRFANGNFLTVGDGVIRFNGDVLSSSVSASKRLTLAIINPATSTDVNTGYTSYPLGMAVPTLTTVAAVAGGTKGMQAGTYSVRIVPSRIATAGYNNPSDKVEVVLTANDKIRITFPAMDTASGQDSWDVYATLFSQAYSGIEGPWYYYGTITTSQVSSAGGTYDIEYNDAEISSNRLLTFDNDPPPDALFVASLQGLPILISCNGKGRKLNGTVATNGTATVTGTSTTFTTELHRGQIVYIDNKIYTVTTITSDTSIDVSPTPTATASSLTITLGDTAPGPVIRPAKPAINGANVEAFPASFKVAVDPPENIIGWVRGSQGRIYVMTENYLHLVSSTGNPDLPVTARPYWRAGFRNPQALIFVNDTLYGYTVTGLTRSIADADEGIMEHSFAAPVAAITANWTPERVRIGYDPKNEAVCVFHATEGNAVTGFRVTDCLMYMLRLGVWSPLIQVANDAADRIVTGVATVAGKMVICATDTNVSPVVGANYQWDMGTDAISAYVTTPFIDAGDPGSDKTITGLQMTGHSTSTVSAGVWAAVAGTNIPLTDLQAGTSPNSGTLSFAQGTFSQASYLQRCNVNRARLFAVRVALNWDGSGNLARLDEIAIRGHLTERRY
jgi:hypothetical protein